MSPRTTAGDSNSTRRFWRDSAFLRSSLVWLSKVSMVITFIAGLDPAACEPYPPKVTPGSCAAALNGWDKERCLGSFGSIIWNVELCRSEEPLFLCRLGRWHSATSIQGPLAAKGVGSRFSRQSVTVVLGLCFSSFLFQMI